jgi:hypothetical protein
MKKMVPVWAKYLSAMCLLLGLVAVVSMPPLWASEKKEYHTAGLFVEGCSCHIPCTCEIVGPAHGCQGVGALMITTGTFNGVDLSGAKLAYATAPGEWLRLYVEAKDQQQEDALTEFAKGAFREFGKVEAVKKASISVKGRDGRYMLSVDGGKVMALTTEPVLGGDKKTPISYSNIFNPVSPTVKQSKTVKGSYHDGDHSFELEGSNSFYNSNAHGAGNI